MPGPTEGGCGKDKFGDGGGVEGSLISVFIADLVKKANRIDVIVQATIQGNAYKPEASL
jgi:hypothetical protein